MRVFVIDDGEQYDRQLYFIESAESVDSMQAMLDLWLGPARPEPRAGSSEWNSYRTGLHKIIAVGEMEWLETPGSNSSPMPWDDAVALFFQQFGRARWAEQPAALRTQLTQRLPAQIRAKVEELFR